MKKLSFITAFLILSIAIALGDVRFEIAYVDEAGEGFHVRPDAKRSVEESLRLVGSWLDHNEVLRVKVSSVEDGEAPYFAFAKSWHDKDAKVPGIYHTLVGRKLLLKEKDCDWYYDAEITVNFAAEDIYAYGDDVKSGEVDFKAIIIHEITHALGFASCICEDEGVLGDITLALMDVIVLFEDCFFRENGSESGVGVEIVLDLCMSMVDLLSNCGIIEKGKTFSYYDTFLVDEDGDSVVDTKNLKFLRKDLFKLNDWDERKRLYFGSPVIGGEEGRYGLMGMDASHFDDGTVTVMQYSSGYGPSIREWSDAERDIMAALGYKLKPVKRGSWVYKVR